jgi:hypothetical protein
VSKARGAQAEQQSFLIFGASKNEVANTSSKTARLVCSVGTVQVPPGYLAVCRTTAEFSNSFLMQECHGLMPGLDCIIRVTLCLPCLSVCAAFHCRKHCLAQQNANFDWLLFACFPVSFMNSLSAWHGSNVAR